ncbi:MAG TPA: Rrf2 family transcriptional regulator [Opitutales bacterium]|nr:Rrf2 family transcriptional regulator [Opitutales bacterium]
MFFYGKMASDGIAVSSLLARHYPERMSAGAIARKRSMTITLCSRILGILSRAGWITGLPGPGGGYTLSRSPEAIRLLDIVQCFEDPRMPDVCPFGPGWCGNREPCPLHDSVVSLHESAIRFLEETKLDSFAEIPHHSHLQPDSHLPLDPA